MTAIPANTQQIGYEGYQVDFYTKLPNMAIDELKPYAYKLLAIYLDTIRQAEKGVCFKSNATIAKQLGCSVNSMKKARQELVDKGYIVVALSTESASRVTIQLKAMWERNHEVEAKKQEEKNRQKATQEGYQNLTPPYQDLTGGVSEFDTKEKESNKKKEKETTSAPLANADIPTDGKTVQEDVKPVAQKLSKPEQDAWYEAVKSVWGFVGGRNIDYQKFVRGEHMDAKKKAQFIEYALVTPFKTPLQLIAWGKWQKAKAPDLNMIESLSKIQTSVENWMQQEKQPKPAAPLRFEQRKAPANLAMLDTDSTKRASGQ
jgi:hypothetical protein